MFPGGIQTSSGAIPQSKLKGSPRRVQSISPVVSLSPVDSGSLSLAEHERVSRTFYLKVISPPGYNWVILSQLPQKDCPRRSSSDPQRSSSSNKTYQWYSQRSHHQHLSKVPLFPHRVHSPQSNLFAKFSPQRSHLLLPVFLQPSSPAETTKLYSSIAAQELISRHLSRIYFPRRKHT